MKNVKLEEIGLANLLSEEIHEINGGESAWYWVAYYAGTLNRYVSSSVSHYSYYRSEFGK